MKLEQLALAIAQQEGWFDQHRSDRPNIPQLCNNPGNLRWAASRFQQDGMYGRIGNQYVRFENYEWGANALLNDLRAKMLKNLTLAEAINIYCPVGDGANDPLVYVKNISKWIDVDPNLRMKFLFEDPGTVKGKWEYFPSAGSPRPFQ